MREFLFKAWVVVVVVFFLSKSSYIPSISLRLDLKKKKKLKITFVGKLYKNAVPGSGAFSSCIFGDAAVWTRQSGEKSRHGTDVLELFL